MKVVNKESSKLKTLGITLDGIKCEFDNLTELINFLKQYRDYMPATEPLIQDKEVRELVRLFAKVHHISCFRYKVYGNRDNSVFLEAWDSKMQSDIDMNLPAPISSLDSNEVYTTIELCGEEE